MVIIDEADEFFKEDRNLKYLEGLNNTVLSKLKKKIQWAMFSATYPEDVTNSIERLVKDACMVSITKPQLDFINHFAIQIAKKKKEMVLIDILLTLGNLGINRGIIFLKTQTEACELRDFLKDKRKGATILFVAMK